MASDIDTVITNDIYPGWEQIPCGGCSGRGFIVEYDGADECHYCGGSGKEWWHKKSGIIAPYPGGPISGNKKPPTEGTEDET